LEKVAILDLNDEEHWNRWIVGTPDAVPESSPFYSTQIQVAYVNNPKREWFFKLQEEHWHTTIEEYYLVLQGALKVKVEETILTVKPMQLLVVPPKKRHTIIDFSSPLQYFLIRAQNKDTKMVTKQTFFEDV